MPKETSRGSHKHLNSRVVCIAPVLLNFWLLTFFIMTTFAEGLDFCYDGSKEGFRLEDGVIKNIHAQSGVECIYRCMLEDESCRSANFRKTSTCDEEKENCELLYAVGSENSEKLRKDENFDYYILLQPQRKPPVTGLSSTLLQTTEKLATNIPSLTATKTENPNSWSTATENPITLITLTTIEKSAATSTSTSTTTENPVNILTPTTLENSFKITPTATENPITLTTLRTIEKSAATSTSTTAENPVNILTPTTLENSIKKTPTTAENLVTTATAPKIQSTASTVTSTVRLTTISTGRSRRTRRSFRSRNRR